jgi:hypothetical protein
LTEKEAAERRKADRAFLLSPLELRNQWGHTIGEIKDLSSTGMQVRIAGSDAKEGDREKFQIRLEVVIDIDGVYAWVKSDDGTDKQTAGVRFDNLTPNLVAVIETAVKNLGWGI